MATVVPIESTASISIEYELVSRFQTDVRNINQRSASMSDSHEEQPPSTLEPEQQSESPKTSSRIWRRAMIGVVPLLGLGLFLLLGYQHCGQMPDHTAIDQPGSEQVTSEDVGPQASDPATAKTATELLLAEPQPVDDPQDGSGTLQRCGFENEIESCGGTREGQVRSARYYRCYQGTVRVSDTQVSVGRCHDAY